MANSKTDKPLVRNMVLACLAAILLFHFAWLRQLGTNYHNAFFAIVDILAFAVFAWQSFVAYVQADNPNKEWRRKVVVGVAVFLCIWAGAWAAGVNEKVL